ncbi:MAG: tetratricopeptide repeat protein [Candidatus Thorarchaeota archaeon]
MAYPELKELTLAEQLFDEGKLDKALEILNDESNFEELNLQQKSHFQFLKGLILFYLNKGEDLIRLGETIYKEGQKRNDNLQSFDGLYFIITGLAITGKYEEAFKLLEKADSLLKSISDVSKEITTQRKARLSAAKAFVGLRGGKVDLIEKSLGWILDSQEKFEKSFEIVWVNLIMASYLFRVKSNFDLCKEHIKNALSLAKEIKFNHYWIALCQLYFGGYYSSIGEMDKSLKYNKKSLELFKKIKSSFNIAILLGNMGDMYGKMGEYDLAVEHLEESINLFEHLPRGFISIEGVISNLIILAVEYGDNERTQKYFHRLEDINNQKKGDGIKLGYKLAKALILKTSSRIRDKAKAEELLKEIIETDTIAFDLVIMAYIHLCEILLMEYRLNNDSEIFVELNHYIAKLLFIAEKQHSYFVFCETFILKAKLALLNFDTKSARLFLTQAQKIAETYSMKRLAMKISFEHDELLKQLDLWEKLRESEAPLTERWKFARLSNQMARMVKKQVVKVPELSDEESVFLLIISEGGEPIFSQKFTEDRSFEDHLFGGFLTTIDYFIKETFSEGLDRAMFGDYTLLMKSIPPFFISYIFKGDSYYALKRVSYFVDYIQKKEDIWEQLLKINQRSQVIHLQDIPTLDHLIRETFIEKSVVSDGL